MPYYGALGGGVACQRARALQNPAWRACNQSTRRYDACEN